MKYALEMGSGGMTYTPSFIKIGSGIPKLTGGIHSHTDNTAIAYACYFFQDKESRVKTKGHREQGRPGKRWNRCVQSKQACLLII
jgi:hypothetical protein